MSAYDRKTLKDASDVRVINGVRKAYNLKPLVPAERHCLKCTKLFNSESTSNRLCYKCKESW